MPVMYWKCLTAFNSIKDYEAVQEIAVSTEELQETARILEVIHPHGWRGFY